MVYLDEYDGEDGTYFDVGEELVMPHEPHEESFTVLSTLCVCCASPAACCWCRVSCCLFLMRKMFCSLKYNQSRIAQGRDKQVEENQVQSMKGCSINSERC